MENFTERIFSAINILLYTSLLLVGHPFVLLQNQLTKDDYIINIHIILQR